MATEPARHRFSLEQYERMVETGVLLEDDRVELIEGEIVEMTPIDPSHSTVVHLLARRFFDLGDRAVVRIQDAVRVRPDSEPEPDLVVARPPYQRYLRRHPEPPDILLIVEVARTSVDSDRGVKVPLYGRHGVPETWLADITSGRFEIYREPTPDGYAQVDLVGRDGIVVPVSFDDLRIAVDDVLPSVGTAR